MTFYWESLVFSLVAFGILYYLLNKFAFGPLFNIMEQRRQHVVNEINTAENNRQEASKLLEDQKQSIQEARKEALSIIEQAKQTSSKQADEIIVKAKSEAVRIKDDAVKDIENEKNKAINELRDEVGALSILIASKIVEKQIDEPSQKQLIDKYLQEVGGNL